MSRPSSEPGNAGFSATQRALLGRAARLIIPPSPQYDLPGADEEEILTTLEGKCARHRGAIAAGLAAFENFVGDAGWDLQALADDRLSPLFDEFEKRQRSFVRLLTVLTVQAYYQHGRVLESLGMEARPPFPLGQSVPDGDWSLLDPVKAREKMYRPI